MLYGTYRGKTKGRIEEIGGAPPDGNEGRLHSYQCLSCHDGSVAQNMDIGNSRARTSRLGLEGSHPVNVEYNARGAGLFRLMPAAGDRWKLVNNPENPGTKLVLFNRSKSDPTPTVQCATCHDPHNHNNPYFLRDQYDEYSLGTRFCRTCHAEQSALGMMMPR